MQRPAGIKNHIGCSFLDGRFIAIVVMFIIRVIFFRVVIVRLVGFADRIAFAACPFLDKLTEVVAHLFKGGDILLDNSLCTLSFGPILHISLKGCGELRKTLLQQGSFLLVALLRVEEDAAHAIHERPAHGIDFAGHDLVVIPFFFAFSKGESSLFDRLYTKRLGDAFDQAPNHALLGFGGGIFRNGRLTITILGKADVSVGICTLIHKGHALHLEPFEFRSHRALPPIQPYLGWPALRWRTSCKCRP